MYLSQLILSCIVSALSQSLVSSANFNRLLVTFVSRSFMYIVNNSRSSTDPCGTPLVTFAHSEYIPLTPTLLVLPPNKFSNQSANFPPILASLIFYINLSCGTLSNAF